MYFPVPDLSINMFWLGFTLGALTEALVAAAIMFALYWLSKR